MRRALPIAFAVVVGAATLLVARPAEAAETFTWVATGAGNVSDPANWEDGAGDPGVPGPDDTAVITNPPGTVTIDEPTEVASLVLDAPRDGDTDLTAVQPLVAQSLDLGGDVLLSVLGTVSAHEIELRTTIGGGTITVLPDETVSPPAAGRLRLDGVTASTAPFSFRVGGAPVVEVVGSEPSVLTLTLDDPATLDLVSDDGGYFDGRVVLTTDTSLVDDVPATANLETFTAPEGTRIRWIDDAARLDGSIVQTHPTWDVDLPDDLAVGGHLTSVGRTTGGSLTVADGGELLTVPWVFEPGPVRLRGTLDVEPGGSISLYGWDPCPGDEAVLVRAAGGVVAPDVGWINTRSGVTPEAQVLRKELVAVARDVDPAPSGCADGASERLVRTQYRDLLGRTADAGGAAYWAGKLDGGASPIGVARALVTSDAGLAELVRDAFDTWSCEEPGPPDVLVEASVDMLRQGATLARLRATTVSVWPGPDSVACLYQAVLGRAPDPGGRAYTARLLETHSVLEVALKMMVTSEGRRVQFHRVHRLLLGRNATADEIAAGTAAVKAGHSEAWVMAQVAGSAEYAERAGA